MASSFCPCAVVQVLFGLEVTDIATGFCKVLCNPGSIPIPPRDRFSVRGFVIAKDEVRRGGCAVLFHAPMESSCLSLGVGCIESHHRACAP